MSKECFQEENPSLQTDCFKILAKSEPCLADDCAVSADIPEGTVFADNIAAVSNVLHYSCKGSVFIPGNTES